MVAEAAPSSSAAIWSLRRDEITFDRLHKVPPLPGSPRSDLLTRPPARSPARPLTLVRVDATDLRPCPAPRVLPAPLPVLRRSAELLVAPRGWRFLRALVSSVGFDLIRWSPVGRFYYIGLLRLLSWRGVPVMKLGVLHGDGTE
jgi:hypothetical protein